MAENRSHSEESSEGTGLVALLELRELLASELDRAEGPDPVQRAFQPITDGLGLESPRRQMPLTPPKVMKPTPPPPVATKLIVDDALLEQLPEPPAFPDKLRAKERREKVPPTPVRPVESSLANAFATGELESEFPETRTTPPPVPQPSVIRRALAAVIDEVFVLSLCFLALVLTLNLLRSASAPGASTLQQVQNPLFIRFAILEFATLWISYFAIGIGVLDMTFGMWVWGMRVTYGRENTDSVLIKKLLRVVLSFFFYAPIAPLILLAVQRKGKNLLDWLSGTTLYRSML